MVRFLSVKESKTERNIKLERRDKFLAELEETCPIYYEDADIVTDFPFDVESTPQNLKNS